MKPLPIVVAVVSFVLIGSSLSLSQEKLSDGDKACLSKLAELKEKLSGDECSPLNEATGKLIFEAVLDTGFCAADAVAVYKTLPEKRLAFVAAGGAWIYCKYETLANIIENAKSSSNKLAECKETKSLLEKHKEICTGKKYVVVTDKQRGKADFVIIDLSTKEVIAKYSTK